MLFRVESGVGLSHSSQNQRGEIRESIGNLLNAKQLEIEARSGKLSATHTDFTSRDENGKRLAGSSISLKAKEGLVLQAGESHSKQVGKNQSYGTEVGTAFSVGAKTGWSFYAKEGFSKGKQTSEGKTYHNSHLDTETLHLESGGDTTLTGTTAKANTINADIKGNLTIESLQDEHKQKNNQIGLGTKVELGFGSAWEFSGNANASTGKATGKQVNEQAGLFAEEGGYHINADNVHLEGGAIASTNPNNSELTTNKFTFKDLQNSSDYSATSGAISSGYKTEGGDANTNVSPSLPMHQQGKDSATTKATLTEGKITLDKDSNPTVTTAEALGINTNLTEANRQIAQPKDVNQLLKEQNTISQNVGHIATAATSFSNRQASKLEDEAKAAEKAGDHQTAEAKREEAKSWQTGGSNKRKVDAITNAISLALAGQSLQGIAAGAASPYVNQAIKQATENYPELNIPAHILWGAIEAELTGGKASTGAIAAGIGEATAPILSQALFGDKKPNELTEAEKQQVLNLSKVIAGVASGLRAAGNSAETLAAISQGMKIAENAVENNHFATKIVKEIYPSARKAICTQKCLEALSGLGIGTAIVLSKDEITDAIKAASSNDPSQITKLTDLQRQYLNEEIVNGKGSLFIGNQVWIPNTSGGFTPVDPDLVVTTYGGKQIIDPRIIINDTGGIQYPADYDLPSHTGGNISNNLLDKKDSILTGGEIEIGHWGDNVIQKYHPKPELEEITGFPDLKPVRAKTPVQGGGKLRARWKDKDNKIFEWDSQHGELEMYDKRGRHLGAFDPKTGKQIKDPDPKRRIEP